MRRPQFFAIKDDQRYHSDTTVPWMSFQAQKHQLHGGNEHLIHQKLFFSGRVGGAGAARRGLDAVALSRSSALDHQKHIEDNMFQDGSIEHFI